MNSGYVDSYYSRTLKEVKDYPTLDGSIDVDVVVIGAGLAGCATALDLAERGRKVALIEEHKIGWGASGRNGGFASEAFPGGFMSLVDRVGLDKARQFQRISRLGLELVRKRISEYAIDCGPVQEGALRCNVAVRGDDLQRFQDFMAKSFDIHYEYWPRQKVEEHLSTQQYSDALLVGNTIAVHPLNLTRGLARACFEKGVQVYEHTSAADIRSRNGRKLVVTGKGGIVTDQVVVTGGGYIHGLNRTLSAGTIPIATFVMATEPLGEHLKDAIRVPYAIFDNTIAVNYYRPLADTRLLWGGRVLAWEPNRKRIAELLRRDMVKFYPALADAKVETAWGGMMPYTRHKLPVIGQLEPDVWYTTGFGGLGVTLTSALGHLISRAIVDGDDTWRLYEQFGLPYAGGKLGKIPAQIVYWTHQLKAALGHPSTH